MAKSSKSLIGIVSYSLCMCLAFGILSYSFYSFFSNDENIETSTISVSSSSLEPKDANAAIADTENHGDTPVTSSKDVVVKTSPVVVQEDTVTFPLLQEESSLATPSKDSDSSLPDDTDEQEARSSLAAMHLRDADIAPSEDDNIVVYAADDVIEPHEELVPESPESANNDDPICDEDEPQSSSIGVAEDDVCVPAHGENSFDVTPEYIDAMDPSTPREPIYIRDKVRAGDSAGKILNAWLSPAEIHSLLTAANKHYKLSNIRVGRPYTVTLDPYDKSFQHFSYEIDNAKILSISLDKTAKEKKFIAEITGILYDYKLVLVQGTVDNSLYGAVAAAGESTALGAQLTDIFGWEVDFANDIRHGDTFTALVEKRYRNGEFKGYGRVLAATYVNDGHLYEAFRFSDESGGSAYFDRKGTSLRKAFLKAPLNFTRISSPYTMSRYHPILKRHRPHQGIDYAAPMGTPVKSVGDGVVVYCGWMNGYGRIVRIRHANHIETMYAHLSRFAKIKKGQRVRQGQVIAYVGSSGLSTGPHLDFRVRKHGQFVNPNTLLNPRSNPVPKKLKADFAERIKHYEQLQRDIGKHAYVPELVVD